MNSYSKEATAKTSTGKTRRDRLASGGLPPELTEFAEAVLEGLSLEDKAIPSRFLYDARGSELFEEITDLDEYYPTRTEIAILERYGEDMSEQIGRAEALVEFGSGSSRKTVLLIEALDALKTYVPMDIEATCLAQAKEALDVQFPGLKIQPLVADFTRPVDLPESLSGTFKLGFFSGSTIGNLTKPEARKFLANAAKSLGPGSAFLIGVDLKKPLDILLPAYNDAKGVTAEFNLNLLKRINRELEGTFDLDQFEHDAVFNSEHGRVEMHLVSQARQRVSVLGERFDFEAGERLHTENSHKYTLPEFRLLATDAGWRHAALWVDDGALFSLHLLRLPG
ncbi:Histidine-specific methyltransferase EgtD [Methyloligella halotolerans]|uniref:Histidine-specific methyltransferase EgtD n=1 Tax=Methyloligella halotolerans TaxID=1177755 RepID=A0A1E2RVS9_9HYPH|nr:L-histidine N(alpha)-methyltransferase [Methyloligella halotolerans]ODA66323.1 Histidine-specific methyltransferase EgtD [Methyloligella halotolerans]